MHAVSQRIHRKALAGIPLISTQSTFLILVCLEISRVSRVSWRQFLVKYLLLSLCFVLASLGYVPYCGSLLFQSVCSSEVQYWFNGFNVRHSRRIGTSRWKGLAGILKYLLSTALLLEVGWALDCIPLADFIVQAYGGCMDMLLALLPWKVIWKLQMKEKEKLGVGIAMSMGVL